MRGTGFMVELTSEEYEAAVARGKTRMHGPRAKSAHYDAGRNRVIVRLTTRRRDRLSRRATPKVSRNPRPRRTSMRSSSKHSVSEFIFRGST